MKSNCLVYGMSSSLYEAENASSSSGSSTDRIEMLQSDQQHSQQLQTQSQMLPHRLKEDDEDSEILGDFSAHRRFLEEDYVQTAPSNNNPTTVAQDNQQEDIAIADNTHATQDLSCVDINISKIPAEVSEQRDTGLENLSMLRTEVNQFLGLLQKSIQKPSHNSLDNHLDNYEHGIAISGQQMTMQEGQTNIGTQMIQQVEDQQLADTMNSENRRTTQEKALSIIFSESEKSSPVQARSLQNSDRDFDSNSNNNPRQQQHQHQQQDLSVHQHTPQEETQISREDLQRIVIQMSEEINEMRSELQKGEKKRDGYRRTNEMLQQVLEATKQQIQHLITQHSLLQQDHNEALNTNEQLINKVEQYRQTIDRQAREGMQLKYELQAVNEKYQTAQQTTDRLQAKNAALALSLMTLQRYSQSLHQTLTDIAINLNESSSDSSDASIRAMFQKILKAAGTSIPNPQDSLQKISSANFQRHNISTNKASNNTNNRRSSSTSNSSIHMQSLSKSREHSLGHANQGTTLIPAPGFTDTILNTTTTNTSRINTNSHNLHAGGHGSGGSEKKLREISPSSTYWNQSSSSIHSISYKSPSCERKTSHREQQQSLQHGVSQHQQQQQPQPLQEIANTRVKGQMNQHKTTYVTPSKYEQTQKSTIKTIHPSKSEQLYQQQLQQHQQQSQSMQLKGKTSPKNTGQKLSLRDQKRIEETYRQLFLKQLKQTKKDDTM